MRCGSFEGDQVSSSFAAQMQQGSRIGLFHFCSGLMEESLALDELAQAIILSLALSTNRVEQRARCLVGRMRKIKAQLAERDGYTKRSYENLVR